MTRESLLEKAEEWFSSQNWKPHSFQTECWHAVLSGKNGLLNAPTGSGKTYALWIGIALMNLLKTGNKKPAGGLKAIWITPLRALSHEILQAVDRFNSEFGTGLTVGIRTGDSSQKERAAQKRKMPDLLITTPESLHLLLSSKGYKNTFKDCNAVVVDEWHELLGSKRGVQTELALSRIRKLGDEVCIWGISATIGNLKQAREVLLGPGTAEFNNSILIRAALKKQIHVHSLLPETMERFPWRGHLGLHLLEQIIPVIQNSKTTLVFTNTRSQCEIWYQSILSACPDLAGEIAMHHGSIDKASRIWVEEAIRSERLKAVICTSSLDLGVDFAPVETIIQIGGPKGVARFVQRAGRSKHRPGEESIIYFLPTHAMELVEASALKKAVNSGKTEKRIPYLLCYDVLIQYLITLAVSDGFKPEVVLAEIRHTYCYRDLTDDEWQWILNFITLGSQSLRSYDEYHKVIIDEEGRYRVTSRKIAMRHRLSIGTIVSDAMLKVRYMKGGHIGMIEEWFISRLKPGDVFTFAGRNLELYKIKDMEVLVKRSTAKSSKIPSWLGGRMSFSSQMSELLRRELYLVAKNEEDTQELKALKPVFEQQQKESIIPGDEEFLIETFQTREGYHLLCYPFEGRFVHEAMASLLAYRISLLKPISFSIAFNDYGFELLSDQEVDVQEIIDNELFSNQYVHSDLESSLNATEMSRRKFRDIAVIAGLVFQGFPEKQLKSKHLQSSTQLLFDVFRDYEDNNLLYLQAYRETFEYSLEEGRLQKALERISGQKLVWKHCSKPTPFSFPVITDRLREKLSSEKLADRIRKMQIQFGK
ncbi:ligase-associated DNA damage response DEXH box helicase [Robertkochia solimangrovi]|uniref:ligase-associated DNA damage response DEXH box helicase n=1 Tax=Robertkochia solimangrovi TaxID=2213046 RepID=UPI00117F41B7|nr:ligase-associated DNA damage response DEXH box helicase [Robertkochia solimangrovi]TRZ46312.1 ligase-associated DNA damage response DEXH box helicase [Robertkochia solimangrovi]